MGQVISTGPVVGSVSRIMKRHCLCLPRVHPTGMPFRTKSIHKGRDYSLKGEY